MVNVLSIMVNFLHTDCKNEKIICTNKIKLDLYLPKEIILSENEIDKNIFRVPILRTEFELKEIAKYSFLFLKIRMYTHPRMRFTRMIKTKNYPGISFTGRHLSRNHE